MPLACACGALAATLRHRCGRRVVTMGGLGVRNAPAASTLDARLRRRPPAPLSPLSTPLSAVASASHAGRGGQCLSPSTYVSALSRRVVLAAPGPRSIAVARCGWALERPPAQQQGIRCSAAMYTTRPIHVGVRWLLVEEEGGAGVEPGWNMMLGALGFQHSETGEFTHPHPQSSPPSEQQQHSTSY